MYCGFLQTCMVSYARVEKAPFFGPVGTALWSRSRLRSPPECASHSVSGLYVPWITTKSITFMNCLIFSVKFPIFIIPLLTQPSLLCSQGEVLSAAARASMDLRPRWVFGDLCGLWLEIGVWLWFHQSEMENSNNLEYRPPETQWSFTEMFDQFFLSWFTIGWICWEFLG